VRYADLLADREGQRLQSPLLDLIGLLSANPTLPGNHPGTQQHTHDQSSSQQHQVPCAVIYCHRREDCTAVAAALTAHGVPAEAYHAGLPAATRSRVLQDWQARRLQVVAATVAFGMVRWRRRQLWWS
jgi:superfamily II DNA/RNA helicase